MDDSTKSRIISSALEEFTENGFLGTSMGKIAKSAQVNKSLIYHYFKSKEDLWIYTKQVSFNESSKDWRPIRSDTLQNFVTDLVDVRFSVYGQDNMRKLLHWQALEPNPSKFYGGNVNEKNSPFHIAEYIQDLQNKNLIRTDMDHYILAGIVFGLASYAFFDFANAYDFSKDQVLSYKKLACETLCRALDSNQK